MVRSSAPARTGAVVYVGVELGEEVLIGHHTLLRTAVTIGAGSQLGHHLTVERAVRLGRDVRCSPGSHITSSTVVADRVFLGAGVRTINDKTLIWRHPDREPVLVPPRFDRGCKVGAGCVVLGGVTVGRDALVGAGSLIKGRPARRAHLWPPGPRPRQGDPVSGDAITLWLHPLRHVVDPAGTVDWARLHEFAAALDDVLADQPVGPELPAGPERSRRLRRVRRDLVAGHGFGDEPALWQLVAQFVCGYRDIDLRDATGLGHGRLIARHAGHSTRTRWVPRLLAGELAGIAITEPHGGSRVMQTAPAPFSPQMGTCWSPGGKCWISRITEAAVFVVFFRDPGDRLDAAAVDATSAGLRRTPIPPAGLAGWTWGVLDLDRVRVHPDDVLAGDGMALLREHFATYRPWVTATALGAAAAVFDSVTTALAARDVPRHSRTTP